jgi:hypothetical protein
LDFQANARGSSIIGFFSRSGTNKTNRSHITPSPEQEAAAIPRPKSPLRRPFSWASRGARALTSDGDPSQSETKAVLELGDLIKLQTASPAYTLKRLASCEVQLKQNDVHRAHLLETAKVAVQAAHGEFNRASHAARQRECKGGGVGTFGAAPTVQFADATDLRAFAGDAKRAADDLDNGLSGYDMFRYLGGQCSHAAASLKGVVESVGRGGACWGRVSVVEKTFVVKSPRAGADVRSLGAIWVFGGADAGIACLSSR